MSAKQTAVTETVKLAPPSGILATGALGVQIEQWVLLLTLIYTIALLVHKFWQIYWDVKDRREKERNKERDNGQS